ncbi:MAG: hypothetical protein HZB50_08035 [Chloroflexi bacterium]|nr:hypothetical protein [Chloroflexota bacterium]
MEIGESKNVALTQIFSNAIWPQFASFLSSASGLSAEELRAHPETEHLRQTVYEEMRGLSVVRIKIYDLEGTAIFSTEETQIGEDQSKDDGFLTALNGGVISELTHRDTMNTFDSQIENRDVISSYIPIRHGDSGVVGVFEVYDDVTPLLVKISTAQRNIAVGVVVILTLLYGILFFLVRRADNLIKQQFVEQQQSEEEIKKAYNREENVNEFFHFTLLNLIEYVNRGTEKAELLTYLKQIKQQFDDLKYWIPKN